MDEKEIKDLFYNKLNLEDNIREIFHPFNNAEDYIKYGNSAYFNNALKKTN